MKISVRVAPGAKKDMVKKDDGFWRVYTTAPAVEGKANKSIIPILAKHFGVRKRQVEIIKGMKIRDKVIEIKE